MDKASDFESEDCEFESRRGRNPIFYGTPIEYNISFSRRVHLTQRAVTGWSCIHFASLG